MKYDPQVHHRRSIRVQSYDYSQPGSDFVTLVTFQRKPLFGEVRDEEMILSESGRIVWEIWCSLPERYPEIELDEAIVMPNDFHGILWINGDVGAIHELPQLENELPLKASDLEDERLRRRRMVLPKVIGYFKMNAAKAINLHQRRPGAPVWQRDYFERIMRGETELNDTRLYIRDNPRRWQYDQDVH